MSLHAVRSRTARSKLNDVVATEPIPVPLAPPAEWFTPPPEMAARAAQGLPTKLQVVLDGPNAGHVFGHVAPRGQCILDGRPGCWSIPESDDLHWSMQGVTELADGSMLETGVIPMDCNHAPANGGAAEAIDFMANSGVQLARVRYAWDQVGITACGENLPSGCQARHSLIAYSGEVPMSP